MTNERDFDRIARAFMAEGTTQLADRVLERSLADETNAWELQSDQTWKRRTPSEHEPRSVQRELMVGHAARAAEAQTQST